MKIKSIKYNTRKADVYDFETPSHSYILGNGCVSHNTQEIYSKAVVSGGTGIYYSASNIFIIGRQQEKEGTEVVGYNFVLNVEKSRYVKEKSKIPITVTYDGGISKYSGLLDMALESGHVIKPSNGWYSRVDIDGVIEDKKWRIKNTISKEFWDDILKQDSFAKWIENKYKLVSEKMSIQDEDIDILDEDLDTL